MKTNELIKILKASVINLADADRIVESGYAGDFLSYVMGKAPDNCAWFTVMNNVNVCAVATLADVSVVVLCDGVLPDEKLKEKAVQRCINLIVTQMDIFNAIKEVGGYIK